MRNFNLFLAILFITIGITDIVITYYEPFSFKTIVSLFILFCGVNLFNEYIRLLTE
jgi:hypothetical protein